RAYGTDYVKYYEHYLKWGINEGRVATGVTTLQNPVTVQDGTDYSLVYDYDYYTKNNPDVVRAYGQDDIAVLGHFVKYGMKEQRQAISTFNEKSYRYTYSDLRLAYGLDYEKYYLHYIKYGNKEIRKGTGTTSFTPITTLDGTDYSLVYDFNYYISRYPDMKKYFGDDDAGAIKHFVKYGMREERRAISSFDEQSYRYRYQDLRYAYRTDYAKYYMHYIKYGQKEKRNAASGLTDFVSPVTRLDGIDYSPVYDFKYYVTNQKSAAAYKNDDVGALIYFVNTGMSQRHQASENFEVMSYRRAYTDLRADYGDDFPAYYLHYIEKGKKEGRTKTTGWVSNGLVVCLDPGHQRRANTAKEPIGPGSSTMKMKVTGGASGTVTRNAEYEIVLNIAFMLRDELEDRGYTVILTRTSHDVNLTNIERAKIAAEADADIFIRLHCDSNTSSSLNGVHCLGPAENNPYLSSEVIRKSNILCDCLQAGQVAQTGQNTRKNSKVNNMTGINWAEMPVSIIEMGFLSNPSEDRFLGKTSNQKLISKGLANGIDNYFAKVG
ncbi:MAG: N-acetylmuramoyl-L-alanine amidase, partial [Lachnospiraceae bacterium]|nr:N-acetylmuramoyl-L-alanine amidase [Lachnospiraceae bacterium]